MGFKRTQSENVTLLHKEAQKPHKRSTERSNASKEDCYRNHWF